MNAIVTVSYCLAHAITPGQLVDLANWHASEAAKATYAGEKAQAERHTYIEDVLCARARQLALAL
jgi:hypothetical protein